MDHLQADDKLIVMYRQRLPSAFDLQEVKIYNFISWAFCMGSPDKAAKIFQFEESV